MEILKKYLDENEYKDLEEKEIQYLNFAITNILNMEKSEEILIELIDFIKRNYCFNKKRRFISLRWILNEITDPRF